VRVEDSKSVDKMEGLAYTKHETEIRCRMALSCPPGLLGEELGPTSIADTTHSGGRHE
jgi:hypothetical protein